MKAKIQGFVVDRLAALFRTPSPMRRTTDGAVAGAEPFAVGAVRVRRGRLEDVPAVARLMQGSLFRARAASAPHKGAPTVQPGGNDPNPRITGATPEVAWHAPPPAGFPTLRRHRSRATHL